MGITEQKQVWEELHNSSVREQARAEQEVFNGLNSTDTILNLVRECMQLLTDISVRQDGLCMAMESVMSEEDAIPGEKTPEEVCRREALARIAGYVTEGSTDLLQVASVLQAVLDEAEHANETLHLLEEYLVDYAEVNERLYQEIDKGEQE